MIQLKVEANLDSATRRLAAIHRDQIPFAAALALTRTAQAAQEQVRRELPDRFKNRGSALSWIAKGIRIEAAKKNHLEASVYSKDWFMGIQETGGEKRPLSAGEMPIPMGEMGDKQFRPKLSATLGQPGTFIVQFASGPFVVRRAGPDRYPFAVLFALRPEVKVEPRFGMAETVESVANQRFATEFALAMRTAVETAR